MEKCLEKLSIAKKATKKEIQNYLYRIGSNFHINYFEEPTQTPRSRYYSNNAFNLINANNDNSVIVSSEHFLEGCTRAFLINPILKSFLDIYGYRNDWMFGDPHNNFGLTNREYEIGAFVEFIFEYNGSCIGCRYTKSGYSAHEWDAMERDARYLYRKERIMGFKELPTVDCIYSLDWSGISPKDLSGIRPHTDSEDYHKDIALEEFFTTFFEKELYNLFLNECKKAVNRAKAILSIKASPQLLPTNMLLFKKTIINMFSYDEIAKKNYSFNSLKSTGQLSEDDYSVLNATFFEFHKNEAIIGSSLFAKSFLTSEYLFRTIGTGLEIDYTSVVSGYLKSIEQLIYLLYLGFFGIKDGKEFWDVCNKKDAFDVSKERYRYDPYSKGTNPEPQERYYHKKRTGVKAPTLGSLIHFVRYNPETWRISETGKEYVCSCLDDYCSYCRNHHFHKDNIDHINYDMVERIRNNTIVCLYYLLGGFNYSSAGDLSNRPDEILEINDYSFEEFYNSIPSKRGLWSIKTSDGYEGVGFFSILDYSPDYLCFDEGTMHVVFIEFESTAEDYINNYDFFMFDEQYLSSHRVIITKNSMPIDLKRLPRS